MRQHLFSRKYRIHKSKEFLATLQQGKRFPQPHLLGCCLPNDLGYVRLGISIGRKFGNAPRRNRFKRLVREAVRQSPLRYLAGLDIVILPNKHNPTLEWKFVHQEIQALLDRASKWCRREEQ